MCRDDRCDHNEQNLICQGEVMSEETRYGKDSKGRRTKTVRRTDSGGNYREHRYTDTGGLIFTNWSVTGEKKGNSKKRK